MVVVLTSGSDPCVRSTPTSGDFCPDRDQNHVASLPWGLQVGHTQVFRASSTTTRDRNLQFRGAVSTGGSPLDFCFFSSIYVHFSKTSPTKSGESSEKSSGENPVKSCHICGCHGFFGPQVCMSCEQNGGSKSYVRSVSPTKALETLMVEHAIIQQPHVCVCEPLVCAHGNIGLRPEPPFTGVSAPSGPKVAKMFQKGSFWESPKTPQKVKK